jgi:putative transposase
VPEVTSAVQQSDGSDGGARGCHRDGATAAAQVGAEEALRDVFEQFGLPQVIRTDNGSLFASKAPAGLSELSAWWLKLGIQANRSRMVGTSACI